MNQKQHLEAWLHFPDGTYMEAGPPSAPVPFVHQQRGWETANTVPCSVFLEPLPIASAQGLSSQINASQHDL
ncbi:Extended Synaptotagmin-3 [Manis pentadactyla]|nr:Extended Synaptotagmin-3 [Manis pentadactyla]